MAAKSKLVGRSLAVILFLSILIVCGQEGLAVNGQSSSDARGKLFLDEKEADVVAIANNATANNKNCGSLNTCTSPCSRVTCHQPSGGQKSLTCTTIGNNENFGVCSTCKDSSPNAMLLDYNQSFVRLPDPASTANLQPGVAEAICLQKPLDPIFKSISLPSAYTLVYFASVSGAFRAFPGRERSDGQCTSFDPRRRPWFLNGISVNKDVKILVDVAASMGKQVPNQYNQRIQYLNVTQNITRALLQTFLPGDFVEVFSFDSQDASSLIGEPKHISNSFDYSIPDRPELDDLIDKVNSLVASQDLSPSNLTGAIANATKSFQPSTPSASFSRVIIVLTDGKFAPVDAAFPMQSLLSSQTKVMIYKLDTYDTDEYLLNTTLEKTVCSVSGSFEVLDAQAIPNPLYAIRSYFTFLAQTQQVAANNKPAWTLIYNSTSQNINTITVTFPAFGNDSQLIGVAGVDIVVDSLNQTLQGLVLPDFDHRLQGTLPVPAKIPLTCSYQRAAAIGYCSSSSTIDNSVICQDDDNSTLAERICCGIGGVGRGIGSCRVDGSGGDGDKLSTGAIVGIAVGVVGAFVFALCGCLLYRRHEKKRISRAPIDIHRGFPGGDDDPEVDPTGNGHSGLNTLG